MLHIEEIFEKETLDLFSFTLRLSSLSIFQAARFFWIVVVLADWIWAWLTSCSIGTLVTKKLKLIMLPVEFGDIDPIEGCDCYCPTPSSLVLFLFWLGEKYFWDGLVSVRPNVPNEPTISELTFTSECFFGIVSLTFWEEARWWVYEINGYGLCCGTGLKEG